MMININCSTAVSKTLADHTKHKDTILRYISCKRYMIRDENSKYEATVLCNLFYFNHYLKLGYVLIILRVNNSDILYHTQRINFEQCTIHAMQ